MFTRVCQVVPVAVALLMLVGQPAKGQHEHDHVHFSVQSVQDGNWSDAKTWKPARVPSKDDRVLVSRGTRVKYDVASKEVIRLLQVTTNNWEYQ